MSAAGVATATAGVLGGAGSVMAALMSPLPLLVLGGFAALVWLPIAVLLLTPLWSVCPERNARAAAMLDRVLAAVPGSRAIPVPGGLQPPVGPT